MDLTFFFLRRITLTQSVDTTMLTFFFFMFFSLNSYCGKKGKVYWQNTAWLDVLNIITERELFTQAKWKGEGIMQRGEHFHLLLRGNVRLSKHGETVSFCFWELLKFSKADIPDGGRWVELFHPSACVLATAAEYHNGQILFVKKFKNKRTISSASLHRRTNWSEEVLWSRRC